MKWTKRCSHGVLLAIVVCGSRAGHAATVNATWDGGNGLWTTASQWTPNTVPDNNGDTYNVFIDGDKIGTSSVVTIENVEVFADSIKIDSGDELRIINSEPVNDQVFASLVIEQDPSRPGSGVFWNRGLVTLSSGDFPSALVFDGDTTIKGIGRIELNDSPNNLVIPLNSTLFQNSQNSIEGSGELLFGLGGMINHGTVTAKGFNPLFVEPDTRGISNSGVFRAINGGLLVMINAEVDNSSNAGIIAGIGSSAVVISNSSITGGYLSTSVGSAIVLDTFEPTDQVTLSDVTIRADSLVEFSVLEDPGNTRTVHRATIQNSLTNNGTLRLDASVGPTLASNGPQHLLIFDGPSTTVTGSGEIILNGIDPLPQPSPAVVVGRIESTGVVTNDTNHTIRGGGELFDGVGTMINKGAVIADDPRVPLVIRAVHDEGNPFVNQGVLQASNGATLTLGNGYFDNSGSAIEALDGSKLLLHNTTPGMVTIDGGTIRSVGTGVITTGGGAGLGATLKDVTIDSGTRLQPDADEGFGLGNRFARVQGTLTNHGTWNLNADGVGTDLAFFLGSSFGIDGTGTINIGLSSVLTLRDQQTHGAGHTIDGQGEIDVPFNEMAINHGTIVADVTGEALEIKRFQNLGTIKATNGGILVARSLDNSSSTLIAEDGSKIVIQGNDFLGGTLMSTGSGQIEFRGTNIFDATIAPGTSAIQVSTSSSARGSLTNNGRIDVETHLHLFPQPVTDPFGTLDGEGEIVLDNGNFWGSMIQESNHTIRGSGQIGTVPRFERVNLLNRGRVIADGSAAIRINASTEPGDIGVANEGLMWAQGTGGLELAFGSFVNNAGGQIVIDTTISIIEGATLTNEAEGVISGAGLIDIVDGSFTNQGTVAPGSSPGVMTVQGVYTQSIDGVLAIELVGVDNSNPASPQHDELVVTGVAEIDGALDVALLDGFTPQHGDVFTVLTAGELVGGFTHYTGDVFDLADDIAIVPVVDQDAETVTLVTTAPGDADLDFVVDASDLNTLALNWQQSVSDWGDGDFNHDGFVDAADLNLIALNWQFGVQMVSEPALVSFNDAFADALAAVNIPEPGTMMVFSVGGVLILRRRS